MTADEGVRRLRKPTEGGSFRLKKGRLTDYEAKQVKATINGLRTDTVLPGDQDVDDLIPPVYPVFRRKVPNTDLWVLYEKRDSGAVVHIWTVKSFDREL